MTALIAAACAAAALGCLLAALSLLLAGGPRYHLPGGRR